MKKIGLILIIIVVGVSFFWWKSQYNVSTRVSVKNDKLPELSVEATLANDSRLYLDEHLKEFQNSCPEWPIYPEDRINIDPPTNVIKYENKQYGFSIQIPFNPKWGNSSYKIRAFGIEPKAITNFGTPFLAHETNCSYVRPYEFYITESKMPETVLEEVKKQYKEFKESDYMVAPEIIDFDGKKIFRYVFGELGISGEYIIFGKNNNYSLMIGGWEFNQKEVENIIKSVKLN